MQASTGEALTRACVCAFVCVCARVFCRVATLHDGTHCCTFAASSISNARRRLRSQERAMRSASAEGNVRASARAVRWRMAAISSPVGDATRMPKHRLRTGSMTLHGDWQQRMRRHVAVCRSIVRRRACCAECERRSTSVSRITDRGASGAGEGGSEP